MQTSFNPSHVAELQALIDVLWGYHRISVYMILDGPNGIRQYTLSCDNLGRQLRYLAQSLKDGYSPKTICFERWFDEHKGRVHVGKELFSHREHFFRLAIQNVAGFHICFSGKGNTFKDALKNAGDENRGQWLWGWCDERDGVCRLLEEMCGVEKEKDND